MLVLQFLKHMLENWNKFTSSVSSIFKQSLENLMNTLDKTTTHYIRCIRRNDEKKLQK